LQSSFTDRDSLDPMKKLPVKIEQLHVHFIGNGMGERHFTDFLQVGGGFTGPVPECGSEAVYRRPPCSTRFSTAVRLISESDLSCLVPGKTNRTRDVLSSVPVPLWLHRIAEFDAPFRSSLSAGINHSLSEILISGHNAPLTSPERAAVRIANPMQWHRYPVDYAIVA